jgi:demethylmenaquinone methyltransferase/2-methoxy-6-polyprenyl-1,4-benzoquinol methylase
MVSVADMILNPKRTIARYREHAPRYDASCSRTQRLRIETVARLGLSPGDVVLDAASGTGMSFPLLRECVGDTGRVIGVELSPDMLRLSQQKVQRAGWQNMSLIESALEDAAIPDGLDAVLCFYTHDVMRSERALERIFARTRPGAAVAVAGMKAFPWWLTVANLYMMYKARPYMNTFEGLRKPWDLLQRYVPRLSLRSTQFGMGYIAYGRYEPAPAGQPASHDVEQQ